MQKNYKEKELTKIKVALEIATLELVFQNEEKEKRVAELIIANRELDFQNKEKGKRAAELYVAEIELAFQNEEREKRAAELGIASIELTFQNDLKEKRAAELEIVNDELAYQSKEKDKFAAQLSLANIELTYLNEEKENRAAELVLANIELAFQNKEKDLRAAELAIVIEKLNLQNEEKEKRAGELVIANKELAFQNIEKDKLSAELINANIDLAFQNEEKRKREEELLTTNLELIKAEAQFRRLVEFASYAMVLVNDESLITLVNNKTEKLFGYDHCELIGKKFENLIQEQFRCSLYDLNDKSFNLPDFKNRGAHNELFFIRKDGSPFQVEIDLSLLETVEGKMTLISILDITERKIQEATIKKQLELEFRNKNLEDFAYVASHDLQEPLKSISGLVKYFEKEYLLMLDEHALLILNMINGTTERMSLLLKSLLEFSMIGHNKILSYVDLNVLIDEVIGDLGAVVKSSDAVFKVQTLPTLTVYESQIRQIFQNLITNAIKFCKKGIHPEISISAVKVDEMWKFSVSDNGIGIESRHFEKVFVVFQRVNSKEAYEGSGIGLANCRKIAQLHKGDIWLESIIDKGTTFHFTIGDLKVD